MWTTRIDVKNMVRDEKVCNNMGNIGKHRKIKGFDGFMNRKVYVFDICFEKRENCMRN